MTLQTLHDDKYHSLSAELTGKFTFKPVKGITMIFKIVRWYGMLVWNFYAIAVKIMALMAIKFVNKFLLLR